MKYFLTTDRLGFRHWREADFDLALALWGDEQVTRLIDARGRLNGDQVRERLAWEITNGEKYGVQYWPTFLLQGDEFVGCCGLRPYDLPRQVYELGFHIRSSCWRRGYALEAAQAVIGYAFDRLGARALFAGHNPQNEASRQLLLKLGFPHTHDEFYPPTGLHHPSYLLTAEDKASGASAGSR